MEMKLRMSHAQYQFIFKIKPKSDAVVRIKINIESSQIKKKCFTLLILITLPSSSLYWILYIQNDQEIKKN